MKLIDCYKERIIINSSKQLTCKDGLHQIYKLSLKEKVQMLFGYKIVLHISCDASYSIYIGKR